MYWKGGVHSVMAWVGLGMSPAPLAAQEDHIAAYRLGAGSAVAVDERLDEDAWRAAPALGGFRQREPEEGDAATEQTEVRLAYDDEALYVGVMAHDRSPSAIVSRILQSDRLFTASRFGDLGLMVAGDDAVAILLDPFHDHRSGVVFATIRTAPSSKRSSPTRGAP